MQLGKSYVLASFLMGIIGTGVCAEQPRNSKIVALDRVVAVVNEDVITSLELAAEVQRSEQILKKQGTKIPGNEEFERQILERLITKRVLMASARNFGVQVNDAELEKALERIAEDNKMTIAGLREAVQRDGQDFSSFRAEIRTEIIIARLKDREVDSRLAVTDAEVASFLSRQEAQEAGQADEYNVAHILVSVPEQAGAEESKRRKARAEEAFAQINKGVDFAQVAAVFSDAPDALQGGAMGWRSPARLPVLFVETLRKLRLGETGAPIRSPAGFHVLKLIDKRGAGTPTVVRQTKARHILIRLNEIVSENDALNRLNDLKDRIENSVDFATLARNHSDDPSAAKGGELGWISPGDTVPEFERAMNALNPGQVSAPFRTPFGWHIVQVMERRDQDMSEDRNKIQARQAIRQRKSEQQWQDWVRYQRDKAYVEYRLQD
ncbi:MAG: peptidylprolyl isomerase [Burkholderiales bacterium]